MHIFVLWHVFLLKILQFVEFTGPMCAKYQQFFLPPLFEYSKDKSPEVRQAAVYGCGILAQVSKHYLYFS